MPFSPIPPNLSTSQYQQLVLELLNNIGGAGMLDIQPPILSTSDFRHLVLYALNYIAQNGGGGSSTGPIEFVIACSNETSNLTVGANKVTFRAPVAFTLTEVRASVNTAPTGSTLVVDINEGGTSVLSTKLSIDANETTSLTAAVPPVISDSAIANDAVITIDIDQVGSTVAGAGLKVILGGTRL
jgi:hypothetical protein